jgi:hypothetical protein
MREYTTFRPARDVQVCVGVAARSAAPQPLPFAKALT